MNIDSQQLMSIQNKIDKLSRKIDILSSSSKETFSINDARNLFFPKFEAFPSVTILGKSTWSNKSTEKSQEFYIGDLLQFQIKKNSRHLIETDKFYFTPIGTTILYNFLMEPVQSESFYQSIYIITPDFKDRDKIKIQFAVFPWYRLECFQELDTEVLSEMGERFKIIRHNLRLDLKANDNSIPYKLEWGIANYGSSKIFDGIRIPLSYAQKLIEPFICTATISNVIHKEKDQFIDPDKVKITFDFTFEKELLDTLYEYSDNELKSTAGISVYPNVLPVANIDLKVWLPEESYSQFSSSNDMYVLGTAGLFPYKKNTEIDLLDKTIDDISSKYLFFSNADEIIYNNQIQKPRDNQEPDNQLLMWMTYGPLLNSAQFEYKQLPVLLPLEKKSKLLEKCKTLVPVFGGRKFFLENVNQRPPLCSAASAPLPQMFLFKSTIIKYMNEMLLDMGYTDFKIEGPVNELRVMNNMRVPFSVFYIVTGLDKISNYDLQILTSVTLENSPLGTKIKIENKQEQIK